MVVGVFSGFISSTFAFPLLALLLAGALATFRYWHELNTFDMWALDEWIRTRSEAIGVREWYGANQSADLFCSPVVVRARNDAAAEMNAVMMDLIRNPGPSTYAGPDESISRGSNSDLKRQHSLHDAAQTRYAQCNAALSRELLDQLRWGHLVAKGMLMQNEVARAERLIPTSRWRVMTIDIARGDASGPGWNYTGIVIAQKPVAAKAPIPRDPPPRAPPNVPSSARVAPPRRRQ
jgi:hypothetical protein